MPTVHISVATTRCQYQWEGEGPKVKKFEQVSSYGHKMLLAGSKIGAGGPVQCIKGNGHKGSPFPLWTDRHIQVKTLPSRNFVWAVNIHKIDISNNRHFMSVLHSLKSRTT